MPDKDKARVTFCAATTIPTPQCVKNLNSKGVASKELLQQEAIALDNVTTKVYTSLSLGDDPTLRSDHTPKGPGKSG